MKDNKSIHNRIKCILLIYIILFATLVGYYFVCKYFPIMTLKCAFFEITGMKCPGCGITRLLFNFLNFNFREGVIYNYFIGYTFPFIVFVFGYSSYMYIVDKKYSMWFNCLIVIYLVFLLSFGVIRNIVLI